MLLVLVIFFTGEQCFLLMNAHCMQSASSLQWLLGDTMNYLVSSPLITCFLQHYDSSPLSDQNACLSSAHAIFFSYISSHK